MGKEKNVYTEMKPIKKKVVVKRTQEESINVPTAEISVPTTPKVVKLVEKEDSTL